MAKTKPNYGLILILILGLGLRLINLGQSFWLDEASQGQMSSWAISQIWSGRQNDFHPPLFYLLAHFWLQFGKSEIWLRLPSVIFGILNIYLMYLFAKRLFPNQKIKIGSWSISLGICAGFLMAVNPFHVYYSQEFRSYSLLCLLGTWSMYLLYTQNFLWLAIVNTLLMYTHYSSLFLILTQAIYLLFYEKKYLKKYFLSLFLSLFLFSPWVPQLFRQLHTGTNIDTYLPGWRELLSVPALKILPLTLFKLVAGRITFISTFIYLLYIVFVLGVVFFSLRFTKYFREYLFTWALLPIFLMILVSVVFPQNQPFRVIYILPALIIIFSQAVMRFPKLFLTFFIYIALVGNLTYFTRPRLQREEWRQAMAFVSGQYQPGDRVLVKFSDRFSTQVWYSPNLPILPIVPSFPAKPKEVSRVLVNSLSEVTGKVYLFDYLGDITDPQNEVTLTLTNLGYQSQKTYDFPGVGFIHLYKRI